MCRLCSAVCKLAGQSTNWRIGLANLQIGQIGRLDGTYTSMYGREIIIAFLDVLRGPWDRKTGATMAGPVLAGGTALPQTRSYMYVALARRDTVHCSSRYRPVLPLYSLVLGEYRNVASTSQP